ncbi:MAG: hypothetical protein EBX15_07790 [Acidimicrobiia bacterium]|nr:hypothetical protein [Acidimicrobiia bacterium]
MQLAVNHASGCAEGAPGSQANVGASDDGERCVGITRRVTLISLQDSRHVHPAPRAVTASATQLHVPRLTQAGTVLLGSDERIGSRLGLPETKQCSAPPLTAWRGARALARTQHPHEEQLCTTSIAQTIKSEGVDHCRVVAPAQEMKRRNRSHVCLTVCLRD